MSLLEVRDVSKHFGELVAVEGVSMNVENGELRAIIGPNGAGKTTFFNMISGFFPPTKGDIMFDGETVTRLPVTARVARGMARTFQITEIFPELSVRENVRIAQESADGFRLHMWVSRAETARVMREVDELLAKVGLSNRAIGWWASCRMAISAPPRSPWHSRCGLACCCWTNRLPAWASRRPIRSPA